MYGIYYNAHEAVIYIKDITKQENVNRYNISGFATQDQFNIFTRYMQPYNIDINIIGATNMQNKQEKMLFSKMKNFRKQFLPLKINTSTISFNIKQIYEDNIHAHKMMVYKTINNSNYYIENITPIDESDGYNIILRILRTCKCNNKDTHHIRS